jgi:UV DNA damage endonuclease
MSIGYACLTLGVPNTNQKSCVSRNAQRDKLLELISHNLSSLNNIIDYNQENDIKLFRISSDLIPFGSSPVNSLSWWETFERELSLIGEKIKANKHRVSMHPGQYTVLNSPNEDVVNRAIADLDYHNRILDSLGLESKHKIILHIGGIYNDKELATARFIENYNRLTPGVKDRLVLENDDRAYNIHDVLEIAEKLDAPVVFDNLHHAMNHMGSEEDDFYWINQCEKTWKEKDGNQKIHYSQQDPEKRPGAHSNTIRSQEFMEFYENLQRDNLDVMLEVKDKNLSAVKCINLTTKRQTIKSLELEWGRYKYKVLENSPVNYSEIRKLLHDKKAYPVIEFYDLIEDALLKEATVGNAVNAAQHVWGYFKDIASVKEKEYFLKTLDQFEKGITSIKTIKNYLWKMSVKYNQVYLLNSYYFIL